MKTILFLDDKRTILRRLKNIFKDDDFHCIYENQWSSALDLIKEKSVDLVVIDIHRYEDESIGLLESLSKIYPHVLRIGMINFDDQLLHKSLLEENLVQHIFFKPWQDEELHEDIKKIIKTRSSIYQKPILEFVNHLDALPTLPRVYHALKKMIKEHASISQVSDLIQEDISLTAFVLKLANSAYYGRKTGNVDQALMKIGLCTLKDIVLAYSFFNYVTSNQKQLNHIRQRAIITNRMMTEIYEKCLKENVPNYYASAGLLHDIGQLLLLAYYEKNPQLNKESSEYSHQSIGGYLLNLWGLPFAYVEAAMFHHRPFDSRIINKTLVRVIAIVHFHLEGLKDSRMLEDLYEALKLDSETVDHCVSKILKI